MYKLQVQEDDGSWQDVNGPDGALLTFKEEPAARAKLEELYPVLVQMERYRAAPKRTRVLSILKDDD